MTATDPANQVSLTIVRGGPQSNGSILSPSLQVTQKDSTMGLDIATQAWPPGGQNGPSGYQTFNAFNVTSMDKPWMPKSNASSNYWSSWTAMHGAT
jgi:hypothetical protein